MISPADYAVQIKTKLAICPVVASFSITEEKVLPDEGYLRVRAWLTNGDFLEAAEYFALEDDDRITHRYRYQWLDGERRELRKRWDNVEHYPDLPGFPHHVHVGKEENVKPGERLSIVELLDALAGEIPMEE
ncbi:MAG: DUF6516 family protein [Chloroflexota bacterium]